MKEYGNKVLPFGLKSHQVVFDKVRARIRRGMDAMAASGRHEQWARNEEQFLAYMPARVNDQLRKSAREDKGEPQFTTIEIPYSYAILLTAHTYITSTFLARSPILQVQGRHGEAQNNEMAMEALLDYQLQNGGHLVPYYIWTLDALKYGVGIMGYYWEDETIFCRKRKKVNRSFLGIEIPNTERWEETLEEIPGYQGTKAYNVRPQDFFHDPAFPVSQFQKGEYVGRFVQISWLDIIDGEKDGCYFNVDALKKNRGDGTNLRVAGSDQVTLPGQLGRTGIEIDLDTGSVNAQELYVRLVPKDWGLGSSTKSEKWVFTLAEDRVLIGARPLGYYHNKFPFEVLEQEIDGHALFNRSMLEVTKPLNDTLTWLLNTHFYNVRKSLNDQFVVDPSKVVMKDMTDPEAGKLIRLKPSAYGTDVRLAVTQLPVQDVTRAHVNDAQLVGEMLQRVTGVNDNLMGMMNTGRRTATEVRSSTTFGINRLKTVTEYMSAAGFGPWTQQIVQTTQQMFDDDRKYKIVGNLAEFGDKWLSVTPEDITGFYDFVPIDGTLPVDRFAQVNLWKMLLEQMGSMPQLMQQYDVSKIFAFVANLAGLKNIASFKVQVVPDAMMGAQAAAGNSVPMVPPAAEGVQGSPQLPGMGPTL